MLSQQESRFLSDLLEGAWKKTVQLIMINLPHDFLYGRQKPKPLNAELSRKNGERILTPHRLWQ